MGLKIITAPSTEPVSLVEAKAHLRVDHADEDALISSFISAAREECEHLLERAIAEQTLELSIDEFPVDGIKLPRPPVMSITSVTYVDEDGTAQTMASGDYYLDDAQAPAWLLPAYGLDWPAARAEANAVKVRYVAGYADCPELIRAWILLRIGTLYANREADSDKPAQPSPFVDRLLDRYRVWGV